MRIFASLFLATLLLGCESRSADVATTRSPLERAIDARGGQRIVAGPAPNTPAQTDLRPALPLAFFDGARFHEPPAPSWTGKLTAKGPVWITIHEELVDASGAILDREVAPELVVSADGLRLAYTRGFPNAVYLLDLRGGRPTIATESMRDANQPLFHGDHRLVVTGSRTDELFGIWIVDLAAGAVPRAITNGDLRVGQGLGPSFVPPPARHESMRIVGETLFYDDGVSERSVQVGPPR
jgi:hypothetical protein